MILNVSIVSIALAALWSLGANVELIDYYILNEVYILSEWKLTLVTNLQKWTSFLLTVISRDFYSITAVC